MIDHSLKFAGGANPDHPACSIGEDDLLQRWNISEATILK